MSSERSEVVVSKYVHYSVFKIPKGINLEECKWYVVWCTLHITTPDGKEIEVSEQYDFEMKNPDETSIEDAKEYGVEYDSDSESDSDTEEKDSDTEENPAVQSKGPN